MMKQKDAVKQAILNVCGPTDAAYVPSTEQRAQINTILFEGFRADKIAIKGGHAVRTDANLKAYVSGLTSNWLRKDTSLNGGVKYVAKNPGSRAGNSDAQLKNLRALLTTLSDESEKSEVQGYIDARMSELSAAKQAKTVDYSALPADLQAKFSK